MKLGGFQTPIDADRALEAVSAAVESCPADAVEATLTGRTGEYTRFALDRIHQPQDITELSVSVKAIVDGHAVRAATSTLAEAGATAALAARLAAERAAQAKGPGSATVAPSSRGGPRLDVWHEDTAHFDSQHRAELADLAMRTSREAGGHCTGMIGRAVTQLAVANSSGLRRHFQATEASGSVTATIGDGTAHWIDVARSPSVLDIEENVDSAIGRAGRGRSRRTLADGEYVVVMGPEAVGEMIGFLGDLGFSGDLAASGVGVVAGGPDALLGSPLVSITDNALADVGLPIEFDLEGTTKQRVPLIVGGALGSPVTDLATASVLRSVSTGHAHIAREEVPSPVAANIVMDAGAASEKVLIAGVERGVYIERIWYTRLVDRQASTITGVSRDACFTIENGELASPVSSARFTQSVFDFLRGIDAVGNRVLSQPIMNVWNGCVSAPAARSHGFRFGGRLSERSPG